MGINQYAAVLGARDAAVLGNIGYCGSVDLSALYMGAGAIALNCWV